MTENENEREVLPLLRRWSATGPRRYGFWPGFQSAEM